jgi:hypothetical protein
MWEVQSTEEVNRTLAALAREPLDALFCAGGPIVSKNTLQIIDAALKQRLPAGFGGSCVHYPQRSLHAPR